MKKSWDYSDLSKLAKAYGGPEKLVNRLAEEGMKAGRQQMVPVIVGGIIVSSVAAAGITKLVEYLKNEKKKSSQALEEAKEELVQEIKEYDASHPDDEDLASDAMTIKSV